MHVSSLFINCYTIHTFQNIKHYTNCMLDVNV
jgi:hypothetical protein